jgi:hypothetical protein
VGPEECAECHVEEFSAWQESHHQLGSQMLTRDPEAAKIAKALGIRRIKNEARCTSCHFTVQSDDGADKAVAGVSCESCHGPASDWMTLHDDFGASGAPPADETAEHRRGRYARCDAAGMRRPGNTYALSAACYGCHTIHDEELVNTGGHPTGAGFELVCFTQGEVLHNYVRGEGKNVQASQERKRVLFVVGQLLELEYALRALALAGGPGPYATAQEQRAHAAIETLRSIGQAVDLGPVAAALAAVAELPLEPGAAEPLIAAADAISTAASGFPEDVDLLALDSLLPPADKVVGTPAP